MAEAACAYAGAAVGIWRYVEDDVIGPGGVPGNTADCGQRAAGSHVIEAQQMPHAPADVVIGTGSVAADADASDQVMTFGIQSEAAAKDVHATDFAPDHGIVCASILKGRAAISYRRIDGITELQSEKTSAGLRG